MKYCLIPGLLFVFATSLSGQDSLQEKILAVTNEGKSLYRSEMASWYGTDIFMEKYSNKENIGGYLSYIERNISTCIFFSKEETPRVIGTISFDSTYNVNHAKTDFTVRDFSGTEKDLFIIRSKTLEIINSRDSLFRYYKNTNYNLVPLISNGERKVYVLTGPKENGVVIFGNDYLLKFDEQNQLISKRRLHKSLITLEYGKMKDDEKVVGGVHSHLPETGDLMTATDICTLLLYSRFAGWERHMVISEKYMNIWDCKKETLVAITREAMDKIYNDQPDKKEDEELIVPAHHQPHHSYKVVLGEMCASNRCSTSF